MAEVFDALGKPERAQASRAKAPAYSSGSSRRSGTTSAGFYAYALDGEKKKVMTIASNAGHCLWSGIVPPERSQKMVERLTTSDRWTGWGIRTLSTNNPAFNPYNYQTGAVWPHDNAIIAMGFKFYGFRSQVTRVTRDVSPAAGYILPNQLPEFYTAFERAETNFSVQYRRQCPAGLGRWCGVHADRHSIGHSIRRAAHQTLHRPMAAAMAARSRRARSASRPTQA